MSRFQLRVSLVTILALLICGTIVNLILRGPVPHGPAGNLFLLAQEDMFTYTLMIAFGITSFIAVILGIVGRIGLFLIKNWGRVLFLTSQVLAFLSMFSSMFVRMIYKDRPLILAYLNSRPPKPFLGQLCGILAEIVAIGLLVSVYTRIGSSLFNRDSDYKDSNAV